MWNFFSRESFPYEIGEAYSDFRAYDCSVFSLTKGVKKNSGENVSIFSFNVKGGSPACLAHARATIKKLKTLKHPSILTYVDSYEDENVIHLVTEPVIPLLTYLTKVIHLEASEMYLKWGLSTICEGVKFLNDHNQRHNNVFHGAVFVDASGSWKLGEIGYITTEDTTYPKKLVNTLLKYDPPPKHSGCSDFWGVGVLLWEIFNGELKDPGSLLSPRGIPKDLVPYFNQLTKSSGKSDVISSLVEGCYRDNLLFGALDNLQNYHLKDKDVKAKVCKVLLTLLPNIPKDMLLNKIVKLLKQAYDFDADNSAFLVPVVAKIPSLVTEEEFQNHVEKFVITLFSSNDRATRLALLMDMEEIINKINKKSVGELLPYISTGFLDSNPKIRGETVKAFVHFAPKLSKKQLHDDALRLLLHVQSKDPEPFIRTNSTICLGKIAHCLQPDTRKKILVTAFLLSLRDPYPAVRNVGIQAFTVTHRFFPLESIAMSVLPGLVCLTVDPDVNVRQNAFKAIKMMLTKLEKFSESPELKEELEKDVTSQTVENSSSWSGWAFAAITSKFMKTNDTRGKPNEQDVSETKNIPDESSLPPKQPLDANKTKDLSESNARNNIFSETAKNISDDNEFKKITNQLHQNNKVEKPNSFKSCNDSDEDKSDWENDGWGEALEEVLEPVKPTPKLNSMNSNAEPTKKKNLAGPMKLGTRLSK